MSPQLDLSRMSAQDRETLTRNDGKTLASDEKLPEAYRQPPKKIDCKGPNAKNRECRILNQQILGTLGNNINCAVENAPAVVNQIKSEDSQGTK